jgi:RNA polymerase-binding transcription factor
MTPDRDAIVGALQERRSELEEELASLTAVPRDPMAAVSFGKRIGDGTTEAVDRLNKVGAANSIAVTLADVERALEKLSDGTYGLCDECGEPIGEERLEAISWATLCIACARTRRSG